MPYITINKANYYYEVHGKGEPLVLLSGYACNHSSWNLLLDEFTKRFQVLLVDNRGVGRTKDNGEPLSVETMAEETALLIQALSLSPLIVVGHSMGGMIAQVIASKYPQLVKRLVILNSAMRLSMRARLALSGFIRLLQKRAGLEVILRTSLPWIFSAVFLSTPKSLWAFRKNILSHPLPETLENLIRQKKALVAFNGEKTLLLFLFLL